MQDKYYIQRRTNHADIHDDNNDDDDSGGDGGDDIEWCQLKFRSSHRSSDRMCKRKELWLTFGQLVFGAGGTPLVKGGPWNCPGNVVIQQSFSSYLEFQMDYFWINLGLVAAASEVQRNEERTLLTGLEGAIMPVQRARLFARKEVFPIEYLSDSFNDDVEDI
ncbi:hypothetical protein M0802_002464 [Mischocyttarus mexicanus]|nr:hypothetical protein M0802_002464 [Mischocyttarus mexicanus]